MIKAAAVVGLFYALYVGLTWRFIGIWWGDYGLWLHEVDRVASGEIPYKDLAWGYPPFAVYFYAAAVRLFGSDISVPMALSAAICSGIFACYLWFVRALVDRSLILPVTLGTLLTGVAYSSVSSETLAAGMYSCAAPLGALLLLLSVLAYLGVVTRSRALNVASVSLFCALAILTKQDFWVPAACVLGFSAFSLYRSRAAIRLGVVFVVVFVGAMGLAGTFMIQQAGWNNVLAGLGSNNVASEELGRIFPSWERLVLQVVLLAGLALGVLVALRLARVRLPFSPTRTTYALTACTAALVAVHVGFTIHHVWPALESGQPLHDSSGAFFEGVSRSWPALIARSLNLLARSLRMAGWPLLFAPVVFVWVLVRWKVFTDVQLRDLLVFLLCLSMAGRARRLFEHADWHSFLIEVPTLLVAVKLAFPDQARAVAAASRNIAFAILLVGAFSFIDWTLGPVVSALSLGRPAWGRPVSVRTARGWIRIPEIDAKAYAAMVSLIDGIDPTGTTPLFTVGNQGAWPYYTRRRNPTSLTYGFWRWTQPPEQVLQDLITQQPHPIVIAASAFERPVFAFPSARLDFSVWEPAHQEYAHTRLDGQYYRRLLRHYEAVGTVDGRLNSWTVYRWKQDTVE